MLVIAESALCALPAKINQIKVKDRIKIIQPDTSMSFTGKHDDFKKLHDITIKMEIDIVAMYDHDENKIIDEYELEVR